MHSFLHAERDGRHQRHPTSVTLPLTWLELASPEPFIRFQMILFFFRIHDPAKDTYCGHRDTNPKSAFWPSRVLLSTRVFDVSLTLPTWFSMLRRRAFVWIWRCFVASFTRQINPCHRAVSSVYIERGVLRRPVLTQLLDQPSNTIWLGLQVSTRDRLVIPKVVVVQPTLCIEVLPRIAKVQSETDAIVVRIFDGRMLAKRSPPQGPGPNHCVNRRGTRHGTRRAEMIAVNVENFGGIGFPGVLQYRDRSVVQPDIFLPMLGGCRVLDIRE
jgi:hypothetical protein